jgi:hypothetical protein
MNQPLAELLPEDFPNRDHILKNCQTVTDLAKSYQEADRFINSSVRAPTQSKDSEDWAAFYRKLGAPETSEGYEIPGGDAAFQSIVEKLREPAQKAGLTKDQWDAVFGTASEAMTEEFKHLRDAQAGWKDAAKEKFGDEFADKLALVENTMVDVIGDEKIVESLKAAGLGSNPAFMEAMIAVNEARSDDTIPQGSGGSKSGPDFMGLAAEVREMMKTGVLNNERDPGFEPAMGRFIAISQILDEGGFEGPDDPKLMPSWYPSA